jgi:predicted amidohydrolase YtcJ
MLPIVALLVFVLTPSVSAQPADLIVENAQVYLVSQTLPVAKAFAVRGGRIAAVGDAALKLAGPATKRIDLKGATVVPGLIDAHAHMAGLGALLESRDLRHVASVEAVAAIVKEEAAKRGADEWVVLRNWDQTNWGGRFPNAKDLDAASLGRPVYLTRVDGHAGWANTRALELAGITKSTPDMAGGKIIRDAQGNATGILVDRAQGLVGAKIPRGGYAQLKRQLELAARECSRLGLTGVHDAGVSADTIRAYRELIAEGKLPVRIYAMIGGDGALWREYLAKGPEVGEFLTVRAIKLMGDGALGSRGAALWQPYTDDKQNTGLLVTPKETIERVSREAAAKGFQVATHAIGDRTNRIVLDAYAAALGGKNDKRFRVEHAQIVALPDFKMFADYSVVASVQATHATSDMRWAEARLGPDRIAGAYAWRRFLNLGVPVANGSDFPVEEADPLLGFYASFTRSDTKGQPPGGWTPDQKLTRIEALESFTLGAAYAAFEEKEKGSIEVGKMADFVVFDRDIMQVAPAGVLKAKVSMTVVGGKVVFSAQ